MHNPLPANPAWQSLLALGPIAIGASTRHLGLDDAPWTALLATAGERSAATVELVAMEAPRLPGLVAHLEEAGVPPDFGSVSLHAPARALGGGVERLVPLLLRVPRPIDRIVIHPDTIEDHAPLRALGRRLVIENMGPGKADGRTAAELGRHFAELPEAGLCLDVGHAHSLPDGAEAADEILSVHGPRLRQLHVSGPSHGAGHGALTTDDVRILSPVLTRCRAVPWILEARLGA